MPRFVTIGKLTITPGNRAAAEQIAAHLLKIEGLTATWAMADLVW